MLTDRGCWWQNRPKPSPTSQSCHQLISFPTSVTNIDVAEDNEHKVYPVQSVPVQYNQTGTISTDWFKALDQSVFDRWSKWPKQATTATVEQLQLVSTLGLQHRCSRLDWYDCFVKMLNNQRNSGNLRVLFLSKDFDTPFSDPDFDTLFFRFGNYYTSAYFHPIINIWKMDLPDDISLYSSQLDDCDFGRVLH